VPKILTLLVVDVFHKLKDCRWLWYVGGAVAAMVVPVSLTAYRYIYLWTVSLGHAAVSRD